MSALNEIEAYHAAQDEASRAIMERLRSSIDEVLTDADAKVWHAHPVWFLDGNPIVGYSRLKDCVRLMFWSGQSFDCDGLKATRSFKAAEARFTDVAEIDTDALHEWLAQSRSIQWDYKNIQKRKGRLERLK